ncbi:hypothetical protein BASA61_000812 [Batrachochytrium salamandrivorans]|nr:hypothetical protein BASA61_000812 [Batrachochytrium salamandrivorans]
MNNTTSLGIPPWQLNQFGDGGPLRLFFAVIQAVMIVVCTPLFIIERQQPMVKYRSWTINILACIAATVRMFTEAWMCMDGWVIKSMVPTALFIRTICYMLPVCCFLPTYLRHYYLLRLPVIQTELLNQNRYTQDGNHRRLCPLLQRTKFMSSEIGSWVFLAINLIPSLILTVHALLLTDMSDLWLGLPNPTQRFLAILSTVQLTVAQANAGVSAIELFSSNSLIKFVCRELGIILTFLAIVVNLAIPLQFLVTKKRYRTDWSNSTFTTLNKREKRVVSSKSMQQISYPDISSSVVTNINASMGQVRSGNMSSPVSPSTCLVNYSIQRIMADAELRVAFCQFLSREFSIESLLFIETVKMYKAQISQAPTKENISALSEMIHEEFIAPNSVNEIILPKKIVTKINGELYVVIECSLNIEQAISIYDDAAEYIEQMLVLNHMPKFLASSIFRSATAVK